MGYIRFVKKQFNFLKDFGFKVKVYSNWRDEKDIFEYSTKQIKIEIVRIIGVEDGYRCDDLENIIEDLFKHEVHLTYIVIQTGEIKGDIFDFGEVFGEDNLNELKASINKIKQASTDKYQSDEEIIVKYAEFLSANINKIMG